MKLSVNILCWNTMRTLKQTLKVLEYELEGVESEIIVVDNGSVDGTCALEFGRAVYIKNEENRGISHGKNQGIDASTGEYILLLDGDIIPMPGSIKCLMEFLDTTSESDAIGFYPNKHTNQMNKNGQIHHEEYCYNLFEAKPYDCHCIYYGLYRRGIFDKVRFCTKGVFGAPGYGWEDFDFHGRMVQAGFNQWVAHINHAKGKYFHDINSSIRCMGNKKFRETTIERRDFYYERLKDAGQDHPCPFGQAR